VENIWGVEPIAGQILGATVVASVLEEEKNFLIGLNVHIQILVIGVVVEGFCQVGFSLLESERH
jgi:hypothetical protein